jgi:hypothetical protein
MKTTNNFSFKEKMDAVKNKVSEKFDNFLE